jgi:hypothetical protein
MHAQRRTSISGTAGRGSGASQNLVADSRTRRPPLVRKGAIAFIPSSSRSLLCAVGRCCLLRRFSHCRAKHRLTRTTLRTRASPPESQQYGAHALHVTRSSSIRDYRVNSARGVVVIHCFQSESGLFLQGLSSCGPALKRTQPPQPSAVLAPRSQLHACTGISQRIKITVQPGAHAYWPHNCPV